MSHSQFQFSTKNWELCDRLMDSRRPHQCVFCFLQGLLEKKKPHAVQLDPSDDLRLCLLVWDHKPCSGGLRFRETHTPCRTSEGPTAGSISERLSFLRQMNKVISALPKVHRCCQVRYRGTSLIRKRPTPRDPLRPSRPTLSDPLKTLGISLW